MKYVKVKKVEGNTIYVDADLSRLKTYRNSADTMGAWYGLIIDLNILTANYEDGSYTIGNDTVSKWLPTETGSVDGTQAMLLWLDANTATNTLTLKTRLNKDADNEITETYEFNVVVNNVAMDEIK